MISPGSPPINRTRLTNFNPGFKVKKRCFGCVWVYGMFLKKDLKESMNENIKSKLASPEVPVKWNKFLKLVFISGILRQIFLKHFEQ